MDFTANIRRWPNVGLLFAHRLRSWPNGKPTMGQRVVFAGLAHRGAGAGWGGGGGGGVRGSGRGQLMDLSDGMFHVDLQLQGDF